MARHSGGGVTDRLREEAFRAVGCTVIDYVDKQFAKGSDHGVAMCGTFVAALRGR